MSSIQVYGSGPIVSYEAVAAITAGQLLIPATGATTDMQGVGPATAAAVNVIGVAGDTAQTATTLAAQQIASPLVVNGLNSDLAVYTDLICPVTYTGTTAYGARLKAAAAGAVSPWATGTDAANLVVGWCAEPGGVTGAGTGLARIHV